MTKFSYLDDLEVNKDDTSECTIYGVQLPNGKSPILIGKFGGEKNAAYTNSLLKRTMKQSKMLKAGVLTAGMLAENREEDRKLYPLHVLTGWKHVCDGEKNEVKFTPEECAEFIAHLPDDMFDDVRNHFGDPTNFRQSISDDDAVTKGKK